MMYSDEEDVLIQRVKLLVGGLDLKCEKIPLDL